MAFTVFCLENYKAYQNLSGQEVALLFDRYGVFDYINNDIDIWICYKHTNNKI